MGKAHKPRDEIALVVALILAVPIVGIIGLCLLALVMVD
jgi:hypothetical protein